MYYSKQLFDIVSLVGNNFVTDNTFNEGEKNEVKRKIITFKN